MKNITVEWVDGINYKGKTDYGFSFDFTANDRKGITPVEYFLGSLAGCTIIDVVSVLDRRGIFPDSVRIETKAKRKEEHPKIFYEIHLDYILKGEDIPARNVKFAVRTSTEKYCSVKLSLKEEIKITHNIYINDEKIQ